MNKFILDCRTATADAKNAARTEINLFCEIMRLSKSKDYYFIVNDPYGIVDFMDGCYFFNMTDIHVIISEYEHWMEIYKTNEKLRKAVDAWYFYCKDWYEQHSSEEHQWVNVKERLPEKECVNKGIWGQPVLCKTTSGEYKRMRLRENGEWQNIEGDDKWKFYCGNVTHWKPIITPEQETERSKGCPNLRSWLAGCPVDGLREATLEWQTQQEKEL